MINNQWKEINLEVNDLKLAERKKKVPIRNVLWTQSRTIPDHHYILHKRSFDIDRIAFVQLSPVSISSRKVTCLLGTCSSIKLAYERGMLARKGKVRQRQRRRGGRSAGRNAFSLLPVNHHQLTCVKFIHWLSIVLHFLLGTCVNAWTFKRCA